MFKTHSATCARRCPSALFVVFAALAAAAAGAMVACGGGEPEVGPAPTAVTPGPEILSLAPSTGDVHKLVLSWKPMAGTERFVLCETVPPQGTECKDLLQVSQAAVAVPGPTDDPEAMGAWFKYLWLQSCTERECSRPPTPAGAIAHEVVYGTHAWNLIVVVRRLEGSRVEVALANATRGSSEACTLIARAPGGSEIARCEDVAPGEWCGPFEGALLSNEIVAEQVYRDLGVTLKFPIMPSTTAPELSPQAAP